MRLSSRRKLGTEALEDGFLITGILNEELTSSYSDDFASNTPNQSFIPKK
jgi:hypothetical protein